jgi:hypothetical protein
VSVTIRRNLGQRGDTRGQGVTEEARGMRAGVSEEGVGEASEEADPHSFTLVDDPISTT